MEVMSTNLSSCKLKKLFQLFDMFLWSDVPALTAAMMWKIWRPEKNFETLDRKGCVAILTSGEKNSEVFLIRDMIKRGLKVIVGAKDTESCKKLQEMIKEEKIQDAVEVLPLDLASFTSVREFAKTINQKYPEIHILFNNFSQFHPKFSLTSDGIESNFAINYLGHFLLSSLLCNKLQSSAEKTRFFSRIVNITSPDFFGAKINIDIVNNKETFDARRAYAQAKLAMLMMAKYLNELMHRQRYIVKVYAVNPGLLNSSQVCCTLKTPLLSWLLPILQIKPSESSASMLYALISKTIEGFGGKYLSNCAEVFTSGYSKNVGYQEQLFNQTLKMLNLNSFVENLENVE